MNTDPSVIMLLSSPVRSVNEVWPNARQEVLIRHIETWAPLLVVAILIFITVLVISRWWVRDRARHGRAYRRLAARVGITRFDTWWLNRVAQKNGLLNGCSLLISRGAFNVHTSRRLESLRNSHRCRFQARVTRLQGQLFGDPGANA